MVGEPGGPEAGRIRTRGVVDDLFGAALEAVEPAGLVSRWLKGNPLPPVEGSVVVAALGKAARGMARGVPETSAPGISRGIVVIPGEEGVHGRGGGGPADREGGGGSLGRSNPADPGFLFFEGGHPLPTQGSVEAGEALLEMAGELDASDLLLLLLSGGGSALATVPAPGISLADLILTTEVLLESGVSIAQVNAVRRGIDLLKGGGLAKAAHPARVITLAISDVVGDRPADVASGPTVPRPKTDRDVLRLLVARGVDGRLPESVRRRLSLEGDSSPKAGPAPTAAGEGDRTEWHLLAGNHRAVEAVRDRAEALGWRVHVLPHALTGEAREVGRILAGVGMEVRRELGLGADPVLVVGGGETTVTVRGEGRGGRNQEVALGAALALTDGDLAPGSATGVTVASLGTDGVDGPTDAAGALADASTVPRAQAMGASVEDALRRNDAYPLLRDLGDLVFTGPTGTNVMDLFLVLVDPSREGMTKEKPCVP